MLHHSYGYRTVHLYLVTFTLLSRHTYLAYRDLAGNSERFTEEVFHPPINAWGSLSTDARINVNTHLSEEPCSRTRVQAFICVTNLLRSHLALTQHLHGDFPKPTNHLILQPCTSQEICSLQRHRTHIGVLLYASMTGFTELNHVQTRHCDAQYTPTTSPPRTSTHKMSSKLVPPVSEWAEKCPWQANPFRTTASERPSPPAAAKRSSAPPPSMVAAYSPPKQPQGPFDRSQRCLLYTSPSPRDRTRSRMPSSA